MSKTARFNRAIAVPANGAWQALVDQTAGKIKSDVVCDWVIEPEAAQYSAPTYYRE